MKSWAIACCAFLLAGCASEQVQTPPPDPQLFQDQLFAPPSADINADRIFMVSPEMRRYADEQIARKLQGGKSLQQALFDALYHKDQLKLDYDATMTRNAAQTFDARAGNCLSLVIMTAAMARELHMPVQFQSVAVEESWSRSGNLYVSNGHVNLMLGRPMSMDRGYDSHDSMTIDFLPPQDITDQVTHPIEEKTIIAMYMNNRAAEELVRGKLDNAYWWARKAIGYDSSFLNSYNTLGVIYQNHGNLAAAEQILRHVYALAPASTVSLYNLAQVLKDEGHTGEAQELNDRLAKLEPHPPFYYFNLGRQAMQAGDYNRARGMFERELLRDPYYHEFHFWLAAAAYLQGDLKVADKHMQLALENSITRGEHDLYAAKLDRLKAYEARAQVRQ